MEAIRPFACRQCGMDLAGDAPEPCWCPQCGARCSRHDELHLEDLDSDPSGPPPSPPTPDELARYRIAYRLLLLMILAGTPLAPFTARWSAPWMPAALKPAFGTLALGVGTGLVVFATGSILAGWCRARMKHPQRTGWALIILGLVNGVWVAALCAFVWFLAFMFIAALLA